MKSIESILNHASRPLVLQFISALFVLLIIWNLVSGIRFFSNLNHSAQMRIDASQHQDARVQEEVLQSALNQPLFGDYVPDNLDAAGIRQSMLNVKVVGVLFDTKEKESQVLLQKPDGQEQFYRIGDTLSDGSVIKRITTEGVLVLHAGELERLSLPKEALQFRDADKPLPLGDEY